MTINLTITGRPITKKNHTQRTRSGKQIQSKAYLQYEADAIWQIPACVRMSLSTPVNVQMVYYMPTRHIVDLSNLQSATLDILVAARVLLDDNSRIVRSHDGSHCEYSKENPRVEICITEIMKGGKSHE